MGLERNKVVRALKQKGFQEDPARAGQDHEWFRLFVDGQQTSVLTKVSRGSAKYRDLGDDLVRLMARQVKLSNPEFKELVSCTLSGEAYVQKLRDAGHDLGLARPER